MLALLTSFAAGYFLRSSSSAEHISSGVLGKLCLPGDVLSVVVVDSNLHAYRQIFRRQVTLDEYIHRSYIKEITGSDDARVLDAQRFATGANETNVSSAIVAAALRRALIGRRVNIKHPHDVSVREFQDQENIVLLGGPYSNPWGQLFESRLNFRLLTPPTAPGSSYIHNVQPAAGEPSDYMAHMDGNLNVNYVRIAILPNFQNSAHVVLIGATNAEGLEAAGAYLLSDQAATELEKLFHVLSVGSLPAIEFVLEVRGLNSVPNGQRIVTYWSVPANNGH